MILNISGYWKSAQYCFQNFCFARPDLNCDEWHNHTVHYEHNELAQLATLVACHGGRAISLNGA